MTGYEDIDQNRYHISIVGCVTQFTSCREKQHVLTKEDRKRRGQQQKRKKETELFQNISNIYLEVLSIGIPVRRNTTVWRRQDMRHVQELKRHNNNNYCSTELLAGYLHRA